MMAKVSWETVGSISSTSAKFGSMDGKHGWCVVPILLLHPVQWTLRGVCPESCICTAYLVTPVCLVLFPDKQGSSLQGYTVDEVILSTYTVVDWAALGEYHGVGQGKTSASKLGAFASSCYCCTDE